jgi:hypothetical protein
MSITIYKVIVFSAFRPADDVSDKLVITRLFKASVTDVGNGNK